LYQLLVWWAVLGSNQ